MHNNSEKWRKVKKNNKNPEHEARERLKTVLFHSVYTCNKYILLRDVE